VNETLAHQLKFAGIGQNLNVLWNRWLGRKHVSALESNYGKSKMRPYSFILNPKSLRRLGWVDCDANAQTVTSLSFMACNFKSSIKDAVIKRDWLPASSTQRVSLLNLVGSVILTCAFCR